MKRDTEIIAISTDDTLTIHKTLRELNVKFRLISDVKRRVIRLFGVLHPDQGIARPATFIIDKRGIVRYLYIGRNFSDRPKMSVLLQALSWL